MALQIKAKRGSGLKLEVKNEILYISGRTITSNPGIELKPFFNELHKIIINEKLNLLQVDIRDLTFINSSGIKEIVNWIIKLEGEKKDNRYKIMFLYDIESKWQEAFVSSMVYLNNKFVTKKGISS